MKRYAEIGVDVVVGLLLFYLAHWVGLALWAFFVICNYLSQMIHAQNVMRDTLLSRLPDRCALCRRAIEGEGGVIDDSDGGPHIYHSACSETIQDLNEKWRAEDAAKAAH